MRVIKAVPYRTVDDLEREINFYVTSMKYEIVDSLSDDNGVYWAQIKNGESEMMLSNRPVHDRRKLTWLYVQDVNKAYDLLLENGGNPIDLPKDYGHHTIEFLIEDTSGNALVVAQST